MMKCKTCNTELTSLTGIGWIHPPTDSCNENDGMIIQSKHRDLWNTKYGIPKKSYEEYIKDNNLLISEVKKWKKENKEIKEINQSLMKTVTLLREKSLKHKLTKLFKKS